VNEKSVKGRNSNTQFFAVSVRTWEVPFYYGSGSGTVINYGSGSGSDKCSYHERTRRPM
jgi:hypothetical protein